MNYLYLVLDVVYLIAYCGILGYAAKVLNEHHKASRTAHALELAQKVANCSVARVANNANLAKGQRRDAVVNDIQEVLDQKGYHVSVKTLIGLAEKTYQLYKSNGFKVVKPQPTPVPTVDNRPKTAPKPVEPAEVKVSDDELKVLNDYRAKKAAGNK